MEQIEIDDYINKHLPYRLNSLMARDIMTYRQNNIFLSKNQKISPYEDSLVIEPAFEISLVFGRALLQFIGISYDKDGEFESPRFRTDDVTLKSIFPNRAFCDKNDSLLKENNFAIAALFKIANKSVAHLTSKLSNDREHELLPRARKAIYHLVLKYVPEIDVNKLWYNNEVLTNK